MSPVDFEVPQSSWMSTYGILLLAFTPALRYDKIRQRKNGGFGFTDV